MKEKYYSFEFTQRKNKRLIKRYNALDSEAGKNKIKDEIILSTLPLVDEIIWVYSDRCGWTEEEESEYRSDLVSFLCERIKKPLKFHRGFTLILTRTLEGFVFDLIRKPKIKYTDLNEDYISGEEEVTIDEDLVFKYLKGITKDRNIDIFFGIVYEGLKPDVYSKKYDITKENVYHIINDIKNRLTSQRLRKTKNYSRFCKNFIG